MVPRVATIVLAVAMVCGAAQPPPTSPPPTLDPASRQAIERYLQDPEENRREMLKFASRDIESLPVGILALLADAQLRTGRSGAARRYFEAIIEQYPDSPVVTWAEVGLGWAALARGDLDTARERFERGAVAGGDAALANVMLGLIDAANGNPGLAVDRLDRLAADPSTPANLDDTLALFAGYARYWAGDLAGAEAAFAALAKSDPTNAATDDARYAMALSRARLGDTAGATEMLGQMSNASSTRKASPESLVDLDPRAVIRSTFRRYRHRTLRTPVADVLHGDGRTLARASARRSERRRHEPATPTGPGDAFSARTARPGADGAAGADAHAAGRSGADPGSAAARQRHTGPTEPVPAAPSNTGRRVAVILLVACVGAALLLRRRLA